VLGLAALPLAVRAQQSAPAHYILREATLDLHLQGSSRPFTHVPQLPLTLLRVDSVRWSQGVREIFGGRAVVVADSAGRLLTYDPPPSRTGGPPTGAEVRSHARRVARSVMGVVLPEVEQAEPYRVPAGPLEVGRSWTEPVAWSRDTLGVHVSEEGERTTRVVGDTLIDGRLHWTLEDSAALRRVDRWREDSYLWPDAPYRMEREVSGGRRSRWIYDPERELAVFRLDSTEWRGEVARIQPDGVRSVAPQRVTEVEKVELVSQAEYDRRRTQAAAARPGGMVRVARTPLQRRLEAGDATALDEALAQWYEAAATDVPPGQLDIVWWRGEEPWTRLALEWALERGDTLAALRVAATPGGGPGRIDSAGVAFVLPIVADPERALAWALPVDYGLTGPYYDLMRLPPLPDPDWPEGNRACAPAVCRMIAAWADTAGADPRLRDLAVSVRFLMDPAGGYDALLERAAAGTGAAATYLRVAEGYPLQWSRPGEGRPVPAETDWREWREWLGRGADAAALNVYRVRTGRDLQSELLAAYRSATVDSARATLGAALLAVDAEAIGLAEVVELVESGSPPLVSLGEARRSRLLREADPAPDSVAGADPARADGQARRRRGPGVGGMAAGRAQARGRDRDPPLRPGARIGARGVGRAARCDHTGGVAGPGTGLAPRGDRDRRSPDGGPVRRRLVSHREPLRSPRPALRCAGRDAVADPHHGRLARALGADRDDLISPPAAPPSSARAGRGAPAPRTPQPPRRGRRPARPRR
jgi:hypothetical protein